MNKEARMEEIAAKLKVTKLLLSGVMRRLETKKRKLSVLEDSLQSINNKSVL